MYARNAQPQRVNLFIYFLHLYLVSWWVVISTDAVQTVEKAEEMVRYEVSRTDRMKTHYAIESATCSWFLFS